MLIHLDIIKEIFNNLNTKCQIRFIQTSKYFNTNLQIIDLYYIDQATREKLSDKILINYKQVEKLDAWGNVKIRDVQYLTKLKKINCGWMSGVSDKNIKDLKLIELNAANNGKIKNINHMTTLKKLNCIGFCECSDEDIKDLNLILLNARCNTKIKNINHMTTLKILDCSWDCGISEENIKDLNLERICANGNETIKMSTIEKINGKRKD